MQGIRDTATKRAQQTICLLSSFMVTAAGFKPATPTSVVWYSIQLSYAAISFR